MYIFPPHLYTVATLPWEIQTSHFQQYYSYMLQIFICIISKENKLLLPYLPHLKNVTALPCKMHNFSSFSFLRILSTNPWYGRVAESYCCDMRWISAQPGGRCSWSVAKRLEACICAEGGHFEHLLQCCLPGILFATHHNRFFFRPTNANPQPAFLRATNVWRNAEYLQSDEKVEPPIGWYQRLLHHMVVHNSHGWDSIIRHRLDCTVAGNGYKCGIQMQNA